MRGKRSGPIAVARIDVLAEVAAVDEFLQDDEPGAARGGFDDMVFDAVEIGREIIAAGDLHGSDDQLVRHRAPLPFRRRLPHPNRPPRTALEALGDDVHLHAFLAARRRLHVQDLREILLQHRQKIGLGPAAEDLGDEAAARIEHVDRKSRATSQR